MIAETILSYYTRLTDSKSNIYRTYSTKEEYSNRNAIVSNIYLQSCFVFVYRSILDSNLLTAPTQGALLNSSRMQRSRSFLNPRDFVYTSNKL